MLSKYFSRSEFECKCGCGFRTVDVELLPVLEDVREHFHKPCKINSGCRCETYNQQVGGAPNSKHKQGIAADIAVVGISASEVQEYLKHKYPEKYGIGSYSSFTHIDVRPDKARW